MIADYRTKLDNNNNNNNNSQPYNNRTSEQCVISSNTQSIKIYKMIPLGMSVRK